MADANPADRWLTRKQAAKFLGVSSVTFAKLMDQGRVTAHFLAEGTRGKYDKEELRKLLEPEAVK